MFLSSNLPNIENRNYQFRLTMKEDRSTLLPLRLFPVGGLPYYFCLLFSRFSHDFIYLLLKKRKETLKKVKEKYQQKKDVLNKLSMRNWHFRQF